MCLEQEIFDLELAEGDPRARGWAGWVAVHPALCRCAKHAASGSVCLSTHSPAYCLGALQLRM